MSLASFELNKPVPSSITYPIGGESTWIEFGNSINLYIGLPNLTEKEIKNITKSRFSCGLSIIDNVAFFTHAFLNSNNNIQLSFDTPFHPNTPQLQISPSDFESAIEGFEKWKNAGFLMTITAFDTTNGFVKVLRSVGLSNIFSLAVGKEMLELSKTRITENSFVRAITVAQRQHPNTMHAQAKYKFVQN